MDRKSDLFTAEQEQHDRDGERRWLVADVSTARKTTRRRVRPVAPHVTGIEQHQQGPAVPHVWITDRLTREWTDPHYGEGRALEDVAQAEAQWPSVRGWVRMLRPRPARRLDRKAG